jgi:hypothetical protein
MSESNNTAVSKVKNFLSPIANLKSIKEVGSSALKNYSSVKRGLGDTKTRLQRMFSFNISGPFSDFFSSAIMIYILYYFIKQGLQRLESTNPVIFIRQCVDYWFYITIIMIIFSIVTQLLN